MRRRVVLLVVAIAIAMLGLVVGIASPSSDAMPRSMREPTPIGAPQLDRDAARVGTDDRAASHRARDAGHAIRPTAARNQEHERPRSNGGDPTSPPPTGAPEPAADPAARPPVVNVEPPAGTPLRDRIGGNEELVQALFHEFEPLAAECIDQAIERSPDLRGMLAIEFSIAPDPEHGAVVEAVDPAARNEIAEPDLLQCLRETMLSAQLPATDEPQALMITMPIGEDA